MTRPATCARSSATFIQTLRTIGVAIPTSLFRASAMLSAHNLHVERLAAGRLRAACRALEADRGRRGKKTPFIIALAALVLLAPAMVHPVARHVVFFKALRAHKPATSSVPWAMKTRATVMTADPCVVLPKTGVAVSSLHCP